MNTPQHSSSTPLAVIAIGGNALSPDANGMDVRQQYIVIADTCLKLARMVHEGWRLVIVHGNGPQVGFILRRSELSLNELPPVPMDTAVADSQGGIGAMFVQALSNAFANMSLPCQASCLITHTLVDVADSAFRDPQKPIGSWMDKELAHKNAAAWGWEVREDSGRGWRRVVPSPAPLRILEEDSLRALTQAGHVVVAGGGGGIPVVRDATGALRCVDAVIDKDRVSALIARALGASALVFCTGVEKVALDFGTPQCQWLDSMTLDEARRYTAAGQFGKGSMEPKVEALASYVESGQGVGIITNPECMLEALRGQAGTRLLR